MRKVFVIFVILLANSVFTACTDLDENLENQPVKAETVATEGEDGQASDPEADGSGSGN